MLWRHRGKILEISPARRSIIDFMHFSQKTAANAVSAEMNLNLNTVIAARQQTKIKVSWYAIFLKSLAQISEEFPELRRSYFRFPWPYFFEYQATSAMLAIEREIESEPMIVYLKIDNPQHLSVQAIDQLIWQAKSQAPEKTPSIRRFLTINRLPFLLRRLMWTLGFNLPNYRFHYLGTFGLTGIGKGVRSLSVKSPLPVNFIFDMNASHPLIRIFWDHRVFDGLIVIDILKRLEQYLNENMTQELNIKEVEC